MCPIFKCYGCAITCTLKSKNKSPSTCTKFFVVECNNSAPSGNLQPLYTSRQVARMGFIKIVLYKYCRILNATGRCILCFYVMLVPQKFRLSPKIKEARGWDLEIGVANIMEHSVRSSTKEALLVLHVCVFVTVKVYGICPLYHTEWCRRDTPVISGSSNVGWIAS